MARESDGGHRSFHAPPPWPESGGSLWLSREESRHARAALRLSPGDCVVLVDGCGLRANGEIAEAARGQLRVELLAVEAALEERGPRRILGLPRIRSRARLDWAIEKGTELGVHEFRLFAADRSLKRPARVPELRVERWMAIARAAMKQSGRAWLPAVSAAASLNELIASVPDAAILVADAEGAACAEHAADLPAKPAWLLIVGPEGGLTASEHEMLAARGARFVSLGAHRLRVETAAIALCARVEGPWRDCRASNS